jgi:hypothetical protein
MRRPQTSSFGIASLPGVEPAYGSIDQVRAWYDACRFAP